MKSNYYTQQPTIIIELQNFDFGHADIDYNGSTCFWALNNSLNHCVPSGEVNWIVTLDRLRCQCRGGEWIVTFGQLVIILKLDQ